MSETEFEKVFRNSFNLLSNIAYSIVKDEDSAKDVVQQVFIKLWETKDKLDIHSNLKSYLHRATINTSLNLIKKNKKNLLESDLSSIEALLEQDDDNKVNPEFIGQKIKSAVNSLPTKCSLVFSLSRYSGMSNKEIAEHLNISIKSVEKHIGKALKELRIKLKPLITNAILFLLTIIFP